MSYCCKPSTFFKIIILTIAPITLPPPWQTLSRLFIFFLCLVPLSSKCLFCSQESTNTAQNYTSVLLWLYSSSHVFDSFPLSVISCSSPCTLTFPCSYLPSSPHPRSHLPILSKSTWTAGAIFFPHLCLNCKQKKNAKISNWNVFVEEVKPQHYPHTVSLLFHKSRLQLSMKFRDLSADSLCA